MSTLAQLQALTTVVADTGDFEAIARLKPTDATTNPSLLLKVAKQPSYQPLLDQAIKTVSAFSQTRSHTITHAGYYLSVLVGKELVDLVPGRVSTEVDARLSFDTVSMLNEARRIIDWYESLGVKRDRILIKLAATWEGIRAAEILEAENIQCNLTLIFNLAQARACGEAGVYLISPFVGRIYDWYNARDIKPEAGGDDFGVASVKQVYHYLKSHDFQTIVMGASFRTKEQVLALAGCDKLTISPNIISELQTLSKHVPAQLTMPADVVAKDPVLTEAEFRWSFTQDPMANEKLAEGIAQFAKDQLELEGLIEARLHELSE